MCNPHKRIEKTFTKHRCAAELLQEQEQTLEAKKKAVALAKDLGLGFWGLVSGLAVEVRGLGGVSVRLIQPYAHTVGYRIFVLSLFLRLARNLIRSVV